MLTRKAAAFFDTCDSGTLPFIANTGNIKYDKCHVVFIPLCDRAHLQSTSQGGIFIS